jgi:hypothetical protein
MIKPKETTLHTGCSLGSEWDREEIKDLEIAPAL